MQVYSLKNHPILDASIDQGLFDSFFQRLDISALNISLGRSKDGMKYSLIKDENLAFSIFFLLSRFFQRDKLFIHSIHSWSRIS